MEANPFRVGAFRAKVGNITIICCLHNGGFQTNHSVWCATESGGAVCFEVIKGAVGQDLSNVELGGMLHLPNAEAVAGYVSHETLQYLSTRHGRTFLLDSRVEALTSLCLYPGYFKSEDDEERRSLVILAFVDAIARAGMPTPWHWFTCFVYYLFLVHGPTQFQVHMLTRLPQQVMGTLVAHGLNQEKVWANRYAEALEKGWTYQLARPEEEYIIPLATDGEIHLKPVIDYTGPEIVLRLLEATGLSEADLAKARNVGEALGNGDRRLYTRAVLGYLSQVTQGNKTESPSERPDLPGDLIS